MFDAKAYATELAKAAGMTDEKAASLAELLGDEKLAKVIEAREGQRASEIEAEKVRLKTSADEWYNKQLKTAQDNQAAVDSAKAEVAKYVELYGALPDGTPSSGDSQKDAARFMEIRKELDAVKANAITIDNFKAGLKVASDHLHKFGKPLDVDALVKTAIEGRMSVEQAYDKMVAPEVAAKSNAEWERKIALAREEGIKEGTSRQGNATTEAAQKHSPLRANLEQAAKKDAPMGEGARSQSFADAWKSYSASKQA